MPLLSSASWNILDILWPLFWAQHRQHRLPMALSILGYPRTTLGTLLLPDKRSPSLDLYVPLRIETACPCSAAFCCPGALDLGKVTHSLQTACWNLLNPCNYRALSPMTPSHKAMCTSSWLSLSGELWLIACGREEGQGNWAEAGRISG